MTIPLPQNGNSVCVMQGTNYIIIINHHDNHDHLDKNLQSFNDDAPPQWKISECYARYIIIIIIIIISRPRPAFGRLGLGGSSRGYSSYRLTSHASLRACGAQLGGK